MMTFTDDDLKADMICIHKKELCNCCMCLWALLVKMNTRLEAAEAFALQLSDHNRDENRDDCIKCFNLEKAWREVAGKE